MFKFLNNPWNYFVYKTNSSGVLTNKNKILCTLIGFHGILSGANQIIYTSNFSIIHKITALIIMQSFENVFIKIT